jgi:predicted transcriptional regulator
MKKIVRLTERDLTRLVKRVMNEDKDNKKMDLKSDLRNIINDEYSEIEPSDLVEVLEELLHYAKNDVFRSKKPNKGYITKDEVIKNFKKNYN